MKEEAVRASETFLGLVAAYPSVMYAVSKIVFL
jgi:hypothetical protein